MGCGEGKSDCDPVIARRSRYGARRSRPFSGQIEMPVSVVLSPAAKDAS
jgi:hypothetical protein